MPRPPIEVSIKRVNHTLRLLEATQISPFDRTELIQDEIEQLQAAIAVIAADLPTRELLVISTVGQIGFQLQSIAAHPELSALSFNGAKALYGRDYGINEVVLTWLSAVALAPDDELEINYF